MQEDYSYISQEQFDEELRTQARQIDLMSVPGVWEIVAEYLNDSVLESLAEKKKERIND